jgi:hypothetical protein
LKQQQLIFVYNANSDMFSTISDFAHKILSPSTYDCKLCALTYGNFSEKKEWKDFIQTFPANTVFFHKDEFIKQYKKETALPVVFIKTNERILELISKHEIENCTSLEQLKDLVTTKYNDHVQHHSTHI